MSVGGKVIEVVPNIPRENLWVNTHDGYEECAIYIPARYRVMIGDTLWWQSGNAYWTRKGVFVERKISRVGFSGVNRPTQTPED